MSEGFAKQPARLGIRDALRQIESQESHEGQTVTNLVLGLIIGQVVQGLQDENREHQHGIKGGTAALFPRGAAKNFGQDWAKDFPGNHLRQLC